jgi:hypothetical protein
MQALDTFDSKLDRAWLLTMQSLMQIKLRRLEKRMNARIHASEIFRAGRPVLNTDMVRSRATA